MPCCQDMCSRKFGEDGSTLEERSRIAQLFMFLEVKSRLVVCDLDAHRTSCLIRQKRPSQKKKKLGKRKRHVGQLQPCVSLSSWAPLWPTRSTPAVALFRVPLSRIRRSRMRTQQILTLRHIEVVVVASTGHQGTWSKLQAALAARAASFSLPSSLSL